MVLGSPLDPFTSNAESVVQEWQRMRAIPFVVELAITKSVYIRLRERCQELIDQLESATAGFNEFNSALYAKDKMFSAINWKGMNKQLLAIIVVDGPWTAETLRVMANVYDYVVPLNNVAEMAQAVYSYMQGDTSKLRWAVDLIVKPM